MGKIQQGGAVPVRNMPSVSVTDSENTPAENFVILAMARIQKSLAAVERHVRNYTRLVDEYAVVSSYTAAGESVVEVQPVFDVPSERIESIIVIGPPATAFTLQLGDRFWNLTTDATGRVVMASISMLLSRNDRRILTSVTAGNWNLELMGYADERF